MLSKGVVNLSLLGRKHNANGNVEYSSYKRPGHLAILSFIVINKANFLSATASAPADLPQYVISTLSPLSNQLFTLRTSS